MMSKVLGRDCQVYDDIASVEMHMADMGISIVSYGGLGLAVRLTREEDREFWLEGADGQRLFGFPRAFEEDRLVLKD